jgi:F-type H+-transporting ATPase subunit b
MNAKRILRSSTVLGLSVSAYLLLGSASAWASPEAAHGAEEAAAHGGGHGAQHAGGLDYVLSHDFWLHWPSKEDTRTGFLYICINFVVLMFVLNKILFKNLVNANREKSDRIKLDLERASEARTTAEGLVEKFESRLAALSDEITTIKHNAETQARHEGERIVADAKDEAEKIKRAAVEAAEREGVSRQRAIEAEVVERAMAKAEQAIRAGFGDGDQRRLVDAYVSELGEVELNEGKKAS